jgi:hypothetical protein
MSNKDYVGYSLFDKVIIVAKQRLKYEWEGGVCNTIALDEWQGYVVDPSNKSMLKSALEWGRQTKSIYENGKFSRSEEIPPEQFEFDNRDWTLELLRVAEGSSQGGKLSFWTCKLTKGDKTFEVGINADLLLDVLKSHTFHNGKCVGSLMFARCKGGVGLLSEDMEEYKQALADMQKKKDIKNKKTSKHIVGHAYSALQEVQAYVGDVWYWYEPIVETYTRGWTTGERVIGFRKLAEPVKRKWFPTLYNYKPGQVVPLSKGLYFHISDHQLREKLPARIDTGVAIEYDITMEEAVNKFYWEEFVKEHSGEYPRYIYPSELFGVSASPDKCLIPPEVLDLLKKKNLRIEN